MADDQTPADGWQRASAQSQAVKVPSIYFNGFELGASLSDMSVFVLLDGNPQARLSMSFTTAKTLSENLASAVKAFEQATNHDVMTMEQVREGYEKAGMKT